MLAHRRRRCVSLLAGLAVAVSIGVPSGQARADDDPPFVGWAEALPAVAWKYDASSSDVCTAGRVSCVEKTIRSMQKRFDPLAAECVHAAVFGLAYLRTTQTYLETSTTPGFYADPAFVNHEDAAFAAMYFTAFDAWADGRRAYVPPAWRIALDAGADRQVSGTGDLFLGMNAHVNRDLPFVLAKIGLVAPDGSSRKRDHDQVDVMLNKVVRPLITEEAARFDPTIETARTPYGVGHTGLMQALVTWREAAWRQAEQLVMAPDGASRERVAQAIEDNAAAHARAIVAATGYTPPVSSTSSRDRYCADHAGDGA